MVLNNDRIYYLFILYKIRVNSILPLHYAQKTGLKNYPIA